MSLSIKAIEDLRIILRNSYGDIFERNLSNDEINEIGDLLLNIFAESLRIKSNLQN